MISMLGQVMTGVADSVMVGWLGATPLAASSFANIFFSLPLFFGVGVSYAVTPLVAEAHSTQNKSKIIENLRAGFLINMIVGCLLVALIFSVEPLLRFMGQPPEVVDAALPYLSIIAPAIIPTMLFQTFRQFAEGLHRTRMAMVIVIASNLLNIGLNYVFIYGKFGAPEMGLIGAGLATLIARVVMGVWMAAYVFWGEAFAPYRAGFRLWPIDWSLVRKQLHIGLPAGSQYIFEAGAFGFSAVMMGWLGTVPLAAHQIAINLATISYMTTSGIAAAATIRVAHFLGLKDFHAMRRVAFVMLGMAAFIMALWAVLFIVGKRFLPILYIQDEVVLQVVAPLMIIAGFFQLSDGLQVVCAGALRGVKDVKIPSLLIFMAYWVIAIPFGYWLTFPMELGPSGVWLGLLTGLTITATLMIIRFNALSKRLRQD